MSKSETELERFGHDSLAALEMEHFDEEFILRIIEYRAAADARLEELRAKGKIHRTQALPDADRKKLLEQFGLNESITSPENQKDES